MITVNSFITMIRITICKEIGKKKYNKNIVKADWARTDYWKPMIIVLILLHNFFFFKELIILVISISYITDQ